MGLGRESLLYDIINADILSSLNHISSVFGTVSEMYEIFDKSNVSPYQCDFASKSIQKLNKPVKQLCRSLNVNSIFQCQTLLMLLYSADEQSKNLPELIRRFRLICLENTQEKYELQREIRESLEDLADTGQLLEEEIVEFFEGVQNIPTTQMTH